MGARSYYQVTVYVEVREDRAQGDEPDLVREHLLDAFQPDQFGTDAIRVTVGPLGPRWSS